MYGTFEGVIGQISREDLDAAFDRARLSNFLVLSNIIIESQLAILVKNFLLANPNIKSLYISNFTLPVRDRLTPKPGIHLGEFFSNTGVERLHLCLGTINKHALDSIESFNNIELELRLVSFTENTHQNYLRYFAIATQQRRINLVGLRPKFVKVFQDVRGLDDATLRIYREQDICKILSNLQKDPKKQAKVNAIIQLVLNLGENFLNESKISPQKKFIASNPDILVKCPPAIKSQLEKIAVDQIDIDIVLAAKLLLLDLTTFTNRNKLSNIPEEEIFSVIVLAYIENEKHLKELLKVSFKEIQNLYPLPIPEKLQEDIVAEIILQQKYVPFSVRAGKENIQELAKIKLKKTPFKFPKIEDKQLLKNAQRMLNILSWELRINDEFLLNCLKYQLWCVFKGEDREKIAESLNQRFGWVSQLELLFYYVYDDASSLLKELLDCLGKIAEKNSSDYKTLPSIKEILTSPIINSYEIANVATTSLPRIQQFTAARAATGEPALKRRQRQQ